MLRILCLLTISSLLFIQPAVYAEELTNMVSDGTFDQSIRDSGLKVWHIEGRGEFDVTVARKGDGSVRIDGPQSFQYELVQRLDIMVPAGREYIVSAWVKAESDASVLLLGVRWPGGFSRIYRGLSHSEGWQKVELAFTVPKPAPEWVEVVLSGEHEGSIWFDDIAWIEARTLRERLAQEWAPRLAQGEHLYTGLVINTQGLKIERGMSPRIYDPNGLIIYAGAEVTGEQLIGKGVVSYMRDLHDALSHTRLNIHPEYPLRYPLVIDAKEGMGNPRTSVTIRDHDIRVLLKALEEYDFLGRFAVVFVID